MPPWQRVWHDGAMSGAPSTWPAKAIIKAMVGLLALASVANIGALGCTSATETERQVTIFAAASLTDSFSELATAFESQNPRLDVRLSFAGSQSLRAQIEHGARPAIFASANQQHMKALETVELVIAPMPFVRNRLVLIVPSQNPAKIESLADLPRASRLILAGDTVPAGSYANRVIANAGELYGKSFVRQVFARVVSHELSVRAVLQKVALGEADAGIVYATDARSADAQVIAIEIPPSLNVEATYPIALVKGHDHSDPAQRFLQFMHSPAGSVVLARHGFAPVTTRVTHTRAPHAVDAAADALHATEPNATNVFASNP